MFALIDPKVWLVFGLGLMGAFAGGYATKAHYVAIDEAKVEAKQEVVTQTVERVVTVTDTKKIKSLQASLKASEERVVELSQRITGEAHEKPADVSCRLSDGLRDEINRDLAGDSR